MNISLFYIGALWVFVLLMAGIAGRRRTRIAAGRVLVWTLCIYAGIALVNLL